MSNNPRTGNDNKSLLGGISRPGRGQGQQQQMPENLMSDRVLPIGRINGPFPDVVNRQGGGAGTMIPKPIDNKDIQQPSEIKPIGRRTLANQPTFTANRPNFQMKNHPGLFQGGTGNK